MNRRQILRDPFEGASARMKISWPDDSSSKTEFRQPCQPLTRYLGKKSFYSLDVGVCRQPAQNLGITFKVPQPHSLSG